MQEVGGSWMNVREFADFLKVHVNTVYNWIKLGMPVIRQNQVIRINKDEALVWLKENKEG